MTSLDYWKDGIADAAQECSLVLTTEQLACLAEAIQGGHENYGQPFQAPPPEPQAQNFVSNPTRRLLVAERQPMKPNELIGPAAALADLLGASLQHCKHVKLLLCGEPGVGKTHLANFLSRELTGGDKWSVESTNGRNVSIHVVNAWARDVASSSLFGTGWKVKIVDEVDTMPADAQDALLSFLDTLPSQRAFIATSNLDVGKLTPRFVTRLQRHTVDAPEPEEIAELLTGRGVPPAIAGQLSFLCGGCVRQALLDADAWIMAAQTKASPAFKLALA